MTRRRNIRFYSKPIGVSLLDEDDVEVFEGETDGINANGCGAHIKRYHSSKTDIDD